MSAATPRRIDITLARLDEKMSALSPEDQGRLSATPQWAACAILSRLRSMEMAEKSVSAAAVESVADIYDSLVEPGEASAIEALMRVFKAAVIHNEPVP